MSDVDTADGVAEVATTTTREADGVPAGDVEAKLEVMMKEMEALKKERDQAQRVQAQKDEEMRKAKEAAEQSEREKMSETEKLRNDLNQLNRNLTVERNLARAKETLVEKGYPASFTKYLQLDSDDVDDQITRLVNDLSDFRASAEKAWKQSTGTSAVTPGPGIKQKLYSDMTAAEKMALKSENPTLYEQLKNKT
jgi:chromosome segregation ATPase